MAKRLGGMKIARSFVTPTGAGNEVERTLDFQLAADQGIEIVAVQGYGNLHDDSPPTSDTVPFNAVAHQTLHLEEGATEDLPDAQGEDADDIDTEIFYVQHFVLNGQIPATAGGGGVSQMVTPSGLWIPAEPILSARNITHKGTTIGADQDLEAGVLIYYWNVQFPQSELAGILTRR